MDLVLLQSRAKGDNEVRSIGPLRVGSVNQSKRNLKGLDKEQQQKLCLCEKLFVCSAPQNIRPT